MIKIASEIEQLCLDKEHELIEKYFGNLIREAAFERLDTIGEYTLDLPLKVENEYKAFLEEIWKDNAPDDMKGTPLNEDRSRITNVYQKKERAVFLYMKCVLETTMPCFGGSAGQQRVPSSYLENFDLQLSTKKNRWR